MELKLAEAPFPWRLSCSSGSLMCRSHSENGLLLSAFLSSLNILHFVPACESFPTSSGCLFSTWNRWEYNVFHFNVLNGRHKQLQALQFSALFSCQFQFRLSPLEPNFIPLWSCLILHLGFVPALIFIVWFILTDRDLPVLNVDSWSDAPVYCL